MSKKIISLLLAGLLTASMASVAIVSASAKVDGNNCYVPSEGTETNRYYFYMPEDWKNDKADHAGIYWWDGTDACGAADGSNPDSPAWPGYNAQKDAISGVYYCDVPTDVTTIIWNNGFNGGEDTTSPDYAKAIQTGNIGSECYDPGESDNYPDGTDSFNKMIYVCDPNNTTINEFNGKINCSGEWYYYYDNGEYGTQKTKEAAVAEGKLFNTEYQPPKQGQETTAPATTEATEATTEATEATTVAPTTIAPASPDEPAKTLTVNATSNLFTAQSKTYSAADKEITVTYYFNSATKAIQNTQWILTYDPEKLTPSAKNSETSLQPFATYVDGDGELQADGAIANLQSGIGEMRGNTSKYNFYNTAGKNAAVIKVVFDVVDGASGTTDVNAEVQSLTVGTKGVDDSEITVVKASDVKEDAKELYTAYAEISPEPTTVPTTVAPTTAEPTEATTTTAPATVVPTTTVVPGTSVAPTTAAPATADDWAALQAAVDKFNALDATKYNKDDYSYVKLLADGAVETIAEKTATQADVQQTTKDLLAAIDELVNPATTVATTANATSSTDATSGTGTTVTNGSTSDTASGSDNGTVQTGNASFALIILLVLVSATGAIYFTRKKLQ